MILLIFASVAVFIYWIVTTGGTGFDKQPPEGTGSRTLWEWFGLLLIPVVLGLSGLFINLLLQRRTSSEMQIDREIALGRARDESLQHYLDTMQELVLHRGLKHGADENLRQIARARTTAVLRVLDTARFRHVIDFLIESDLLDMIDQEDGSSPQEPAITLRGADLSDINLPGINLARVNLSDADLGGANLASAYLEQTNLYGAQLSGADLQHAILSEADLTLANLEGANIRGAYMDGTKLIGTRLVRVNLSDAETTEDAELSGAIYSDDG